MSAARLTLVLTATIALLLVVLALIPTADGATGTPHPYFASMLVGGDGQTRHGHLLLIGWLFGALQIALYAAMVALGASRRGSLGGLARPLLGWNLVYLAAWTAIVLGYRAELAEPAARLGGLPLSTALLVYGLWPVPAFYGWLYWRNFRRWIFRPEDEAAFKDLLAAQSGAQRRGSHGARSRAGTPDEAR